MSAAEVQIPRKVWTRDDVERIDPFLAESLELVNGDLIEHVGKKPPHIYWKNELGDWLRRQFGGEHVLSEDPIDQRAGARHLCHVCIETTDKGSQAAAVGTAARR